MLRSQTIILESKEFCIAKGGQKMPPLFQREKGRGRAAENSRPAHCDHQVKHGIRTLINPNPASAKH
jgi:hypothetical protein